MPDGFGSLSRRDFIRLNAGLLALAGTFSCSWPDDQPDFPPDDRTVLRLLRAEDLLSLRFELHNLRIEHHRRKPARLVRVRDGEEALLAVGFPGQHILEQAYPEDPAAGPISLPAESRIARPARLVFKLPPDLGHIELTVDALLDWRKLTPILPIADGSTSTPAITEAQTAIELPYGLVLRLAETARWTHATRPVTHDGRTELWHTRLTASDPYQPSTVTALAPTPSAGCLCRIDSALTKADRERLAGKSVLARTLILSPMGGWLDLRGVWENDPGISLWQHGATAGQDQRVIVERAKGFLFPFGQHAALISVTERKLVHLQTDRAPYALLRQHYFIVIKKPQAAYAHGRMALRRMTAIDRVTPPLVNVPDDGGPFWIETAPGTPFRFRFDARDWADRRISLEAPAMFVTGDREKIEAARQRYESDSPPGKISPLHGQSAAVATFDPHGAGCPAPGPGTAFGCDRWGEPLTRQRSVGDTSLQLLKLEFTAEPVGDEPPFACRTRRMEVRVPSLEPYLDEALNQGWFDLVDPDTPDNLGEVFAVARLSDGKRIPMYFDRQADRCGGLAAPSFDVDGLSRVRGPVGDAREGGPMYAGGRLDPGTYFTPGHATVLGGFPLAGLLLTDDGTKSPAVPTISFSVSRVQPTRKEAEKGDNPHWKASLGLGWRIGLGKCLTVGAAQFIPDTKDGKSTARLEIGASVTKKFQKSATTDEPAKSGDRADDAPEGGEARKPPAPPAVAWQVSGKITNFAIGLDTKALGKIQIGFVHLGVTLGPPTPAKKDEEKKKTDTAKKKEAEKSVAAKIDFKMGEIKATGVLFFLIKLLQIAADLPRIPDLSIGEAPSVTQAKLPGVGDADINVMVGPIGLPTPSWKWLDRFEVANLSVSVGVGFYFLPRKLKKTEPPKVPDHLFAIRIASPDKPLTLMAEPWGGLAHVGFHFTNRGMTGFQCSLGIVYRAEFDFSAAKAKCEGSLAGVFTYRVEADGTPFEQVDLVLKLSGLVKIAGFIEIHLSLVAVGSWQVAANIWAFSAEINVRVKISFFAVSARLQFSYTLSGGAGGENLRLAGRAKATGNGRMTEDEWLAYRAAFAT